MEMLAAARDVDLAGRRPPLVRPGVRRPGRPPRLRRRRVATWPETATAVAVRLLPDDRLQVVAPAAWVACSAWSAGATPGRVGLEHYQRRLRDKRVAERWPRVRVVP
jgi:hypothetical protein